MSGAKLKLLISEMGEHMKIWDAVVAIYIPSVLPDMLIGNDSKLLFDLSGLMCWLLAMSLGKPHFLCAIYVETSDIGGIMLLAYDKKSHELSR